MSMSKIHISRAHALPAAAVAWMVFVAVLGARLAWDYTAAPWLSGVELSKPVAAIAVMAFCLGSTIVAWRVRPTLTLLVALGSAGLIVLAAAFVTGSMIALVVVIGTAVVAWLLGEALVGSYFQAVGPYGIRAVLPSPWATDCSAWGC